LDKQEEYGSHQAWNIPSVAGKSRCVDEDTTRIESDITQHHADELGSNLVTMHLQNHFADHICQLGNFLNAHSELLERLMMDLVQAYHQSNCHEAACHILQTRTRKEVFQDQELNANTANQRRNYQMPLTTVFIK